MNFEHHEKVETNEDTVCIGLRKKISQTRAYIIYIYETHEINISNRLRVLLPGDSYFLQIHRPKQGI